MEWLRESQCEEWLRVSLINLIMQIDSHVKLSLGGEELHLLTLKKNLNFKNGNLIICLLSHWYVYQCMFLTLVSLLMTFHSYECIHVKCYSLEFLYTPIKYCKCNLPLQSFVGLDFAIRLRRVECQCLHGYKNTPYFLL